jgi:hypothetical protein
MCTPEEWREAALIDNVVSEAVNSAIVPTSENKSPVAGGTVFRWSDLQLQWK